MLFCGDAMAGHKSRRGPILTARLGCHRGRHASPPATAHATRRGRRIRCVLTPASHAAVDLGGRLGQRPAPERAASSPARSLAVASRDALRARATADHRSQSGATPRVWRPPAVGRAVGPRQLCDGSHAVNAGTAPTRRFRQTGTDRRRLIAPDGTLPATRTIATAAVELATWSYSARRPTLAP
jgi:hypothetical protein